MFICMSSNQGGSYAKTVTGVILSVVIAGIFLGYVFPIGMDAYNTADTSSWSSSTTSIFNVLGIFLVLVPLIGLAGMSMKEF